MAEMERCIRSQRVINELMVEQLDDIDAGSNNNSSSSFNNRFDRAAD